VAITCLRMRADALSAGTAAVAPAAPVLATGGADLAPIADEDGEDGGGGGLGDGGARGGSPPAPAPESAPDTAPGAPDVEAVVFTWAAGAAGLGLGSGLHGAGADGADVRVHGDEAAMLAAWRAWVLDADPDVLAIFQARAAPRPGRGLSAHVVRCLVNVRISLMSATPVQSCAVFIVCRLTGGCGCAARRAAALARPAACLPHDWVQRCRVWKELCASLFGRVRWPSNLVCIICSSAAAHW